MKYFDNRILTSEFSVLSSEIRTEGEYKVVIVELHCHDKKGFYAGKTCFFRHVSRLLAEMLEAYPQRPLRVRGSYLQGHGYVLIPECDPNFYDPEEAKEAREIPDLRYDVNNVVYKKIGKGFLKVRP